MRVLALSCVMLLTGACTTALPSPSVAPPPELDGIAETVPVSGLPAQRLEPGDCGVFLFEVRTPSDFVFYENETARTAQIVHDGVVYRFSTTPEAEAFLPGEVFARTYAGHETDLTFSLDGLVGEATPSGLRLQDMILTATAEDGTRTVRPVAGVRRCNND